MSLAFLRNRDVVLGSAATLALSIPSFAGLLPFSTIEVAGFVTGAIVWSYNARGDPRLTARLERAVRILCCLPLTGPDGSAFKEREAFR
jgi:hypothetical protein